MNQPPAGIIHTLASQSTCAGLTRAGRPAAALSVAFLLLAAPADAHEIGDAPHKGPWYTVWNFNPLILFCLAAVTALYLLGIRRLWQRAGRNHGVSRLQITAFLSGIAALILALISPIDPLAVELGWVHMIQHKILMMIAAPLLVIGSPLLVSLWALPHRLRQKYALLYQRLTAVHLRGYLFWQPLITWAVYALTLWIWHLPTLYQAALHNRIVHDVQHLAFLGAACLFWRVLLDPISKRRLNLGLGVLYLFTTSLHASALGIFMAFSPGLWYPAYQPTVVRWNLTPLEDQQLAGLIMWMPACTLYSAIVAVLFVLWLKRLQPSISHPKAYSGMLRAS